MVLAPASLARAGRAAPVAVGQGSCWVLVPVGAGSSSLLCSPAGDAGLRVWGHAACPPARPADLSHLRAQCGGGKERGAGLCAMGRGVLLRPFCVGQRVLVRVQALGGSPCPTAVLRGKDVAFSVSPLPGSPEATRRSGDCRGSCYC